MNVRTLVIAMVVTGSLLLGVLGMVAARWAAPWVAWPDLQGEALDREWGALQARVATHPMCHADPAGLDVALAAHDGAHVAVDEVLYAHDEGPVAVADLPVAAQESTALLVEWADDGGGLGLIPTLDDNGRTFELYRLGQAAAASDDPARVHAALRLAKGLRQCGPLLSGAVGIAIADDVRSRQPDRLRAHPDLAPSPEDLLATLHAEALVADSSIDVLDDPSLSGGWERWLFDPERERAMIRAMWVRRLAGLPADTAAIRAAFPRQEAEDMPHSLVLRMLLVGVAHVVDDLATSIEASEG